jgi:hypothetical protein
MAKRFQYRTHVVIEGGTEETRFEPLEEGAPRIQARYELREGEHGRFQHGAVYLINSLKVEDAEHVPDDAPPAARARTRRAKTTEQA